MNVNHYVLVTVINLYTLIVRWKEQHSLLNFLKETCLFFKYKIVNEKSSHSYLESQSLVVNAHLHFCF